MNQIPMPRPRPRSMSWLKASSRPSRRPDSNAMPSPACGWRGWIPVADRVRGFSPCRPSPSAPPCSQTCRQLDIGAGWCGRASASAARNGRPAARIGPQLGFELESADGAVDLAAGRLADKFRILLVGGFGIVRAIGPHLLEDLAGPLQFFHLRRAGLAAPLLHIEDRIHGSGMTDQRLGAGLAQRRFRVFNHLPFRRFPSRPPRVVGARQSVGRRPQPVEHVAHDLGHALAEGDPTPLGVALYRIALLVIRGHVLARRVPQDFASERRWTSSFHRPEQKERFAEVARSPLGDNPRTDTSPTSAPEPAAQSTLDCVGKALGVLSKIRNIAARRINDDAVDVPHQTAVLGIHARPPQSRCRCGHRRRHF